VKTTAFSGRQLAQIDNPDPFVPPVWRSPVYHTPYWIILIVQLCRALFALFKFLARHPLLDLQAAVLVLAWRLAGWPGPVILTSTVTVILLGWRLRWPASFTRFIGSPVRGKWRRWHYQRHWLAVLTIARLVPVYRGQVLVPVLGKVRSTGIPTGCPSGLPPGRPPPTSPPGRRTWPTVSALSCAGCVRPGPGS
jgi:hypothetical protein